MILYVQFHNTHKTYERRKAFEWEPIAPALVADDSPGNLYLMEREHPSDMWGAPEFQGRMTLFEAHVYASARGCPRREDVREPVTR